MTKSTLACQELLFGNGDPFANSLAARVKFEDIEAFRKYGPRLLVQKRFFTLQDWLKRFRRMKLSLQVRMNMGCLIDHEHEQEQKKGTKEKEREKVYVSSWLVDAPNLKLGEVILYFSQTKYYHRFNGKQEDTSRLALLKSFEGSKYAPLVDLFGRIQGRTLKIPLTELKCLSMKMMICFGCGIFLVLSLKNEKHGWTVKEIIANVVENADLQKRTRRNAKWKKRRSKLSSSKQARGFQCVRVVTSPIIVVKNVRKGIGEFTRRNVNG